MHRCEHIAFCSATEDAPFHTLPRSTNEVLGRGEGGGDNFGDLWRCVGPRTPGERFVGQGCEPSRVAALEPGPNGDGGELELLCNRWHTMPLVRQTDEGRSTSQADAGREWPNCSIDSCSSGLSWHSVSAIDITPP